MASTKNRNQKDNRQPHHDHGKVAYRLDLPEELNGIHPTFHVSNLRKCLADEQAHVPLDDTEVDDRLNYIEEQVAIGNG
ncbi:hypothetical protein E3N88_18789 [Mikania micrantha]|uniref:Tf2-1-like SH3-like domain-containing protein n=1 Tax=Mikania micrantha TaxID=192012 RepID=A0A5N6NNC8_9ASTR|nr:hypothetical protein E3N88_18789 [Mikania micrantha]